LQGEGFRKDLDRIQAFVSATRKDGSEV